jgi:ABC-type amino acid transport substrate-binding protein
MITVPKSPAYEGDIDFAYHGGAYAMGKSGTENDAIAQFWEIVLKTCGIKRNSIKVNNFVDENQLYKMMKDKRVIMAGMSHSFFARHESELSLVPLAVPAIAGNTYISYCIFIQNNHPDIKEIGDLKGRKIAVPRYGDDWYFKRLLPDNAPKVFQAVKYPDNTSVITSVLYNKADAGVASEYFLLNFLKLRSHLKDKIKTIMKTKKVLLPPLVYQKGRLTSEEEKGILSVLLDAHNNNELTFLLDLIGFTGFHKITAGEIKGAVK